MLKYKKLFFYILTFTLGISANNSRANLKIVIDYTYDEGYFTPEAKNTLEAAARYVEAFVRETELLGLPLNPEPGITYEASITNPSRDETVANVNAENPIKENEIRIYVGAFPMGENGSLARSSTQIGTGASDIEDTKIWKRRGTNKDKVWGGALRFNSSLTWYWDQDISTTEETISAPFTHGTPAYFFLGLDGFGIASHEIMHLLGIGLTGDWSRMINVDTLRFMGENVRKIHPEGAPVEGGHWATGLQANPVGPWNNGTGSPTQTALLTPGFTHRERKYMTDLDLAGLMDMDYRVNSNPWMESATGNYFTPPTTHGGSSELALRSNGPVRVTFDWKLNDDTADRIEFAVDGVVTKSIVLVGANAPALGEWKTEVIEFPTAGKRRLTWTFFNTGVPIGTANVRDIDFESFVPPPVIAVHPVSTNVNYLATLTLSVSASDTLNSPLNYQWTKDGEPIAGATSASYTRSSMRNSNNDAGSYAVIVSNGTHSVTSNPAVVNVAKLAHTLNFAPLGNNGKGNLNAKIPAFVVSSLARPISYEITEGVASLFGNSLTLTSFGSVTIRAWSPGNADIEDAEAFRTVTVSPDDPYVVVENATVVYDGTPKAVVASLMSPGGLSPTLNVTYNGLVTPPRNVGTYQVQASVPGQNIAANSTLTITKRPLVISANDTGRLAGEKNPALPVTVTGLVGRENWRRKPVGTTTALPTSPIGEYPISVNFVNEAFLANYEVRTEAGVLTVTGADNRGTYLASVEDAEGRTTGRLRFVLGTGLASSASLSHGDYAKDVAFKGVARVVEGGDILVNFTSRDGRTLALILTGGSLSGSLSGNSAGLKTHTVAGRRLATTVALNGARFTGLLHDPIRVDDFGPEAGGSLTATVAKNVATLRGTLGDGRPFTATGNFDDAGLLPLFARPYGARVNAFLGGTLFLTPEGSVDEIDGESLNLRLRKSPGLKDPSYRGGFDLDYNATVRPWTLAPVNRTATLSYLPFGTVLGANVDNLPTSITLVNGKLTTRLPNSFTFAAKADGSFSGRFFLEGSIRRTATFNGVFINTGAENPLPLGLGTYTVRNLESTLLDSGNLSLTE